MKITVKDVNYVSRLALLGLEEEEKEKIARELSSILEYMETMGELDTGGVEPTAHVLPNKNVFRKDEVRPADIREEALAIAPRREGSYYKVPPILEGEQGTEGGADREG